MFTAEYRNQQFNDGAFLDIVANTLFSRCKFTGVLPDFRLCEFHDCDLSGAQVRQLINCKLFSTCLDSADFSKADVRFSVTSPGSPCSARGVEWQGISAVLDCGWWAGLKGAEEDASLFLIMALIPETPAKKKLYKTFPESLQKEVRRRMNKQFRTERA